MQVTAARQATSHEPTSSVVGPQPVLVPRPPLPGLLLCVMGRVRLRATRGVHGPLVWAKTGQD
jgi:hypothetical protein